MKNIRLNKLWLVLLIAILTIPFIVYATTQQTPDARFSAPVPEVDLSEFTVIYFAPQDTGNEYTQPSLLQRDGIQVVHTWDDFIERTQEGSIDAIVLHVDLLDQINAETISRYYHSGVAIAGFNFTGSQMEQMTGNSCISRDGFASEATGNHFVISVQRAWADDSDELARVLQAENASCGEETVEGITGRVQTSRRNSTELINTYEGYQFFKFDLFTTLERYSR